jgi:invasion associated locus B (IalB) protein
MGLKREWRVKNYGLGLCAAAVVLIASAAMAQDKPELLGSYRDWFAYRVGSGVERQCYALSQPKQKNPAGMKRDEVFFLISTWPAKRVKDEPSVVPGYAYKEGAKVQLEVGSDRFELFTRNDGNSGGAWMDDPAQERKLVEAMKRGAAFSVTGLPEHGTITRDNYSLAGISAALEKVAASCK